MSKRDGGPDEAPRAFGVGRIAMRQLRSRPALTVAQTVILAAATTLLASVVLIQNTATDNGLRSGLSQAAAGQAANVVIERDGSVGAAGFDSFQRDARARVRSLLGNTVVAGAQVGRSPAQTIRAVDGVEQGQPLSSVSSLAFYNGLRDHVRVVSGHWPADTRSGRDWMLTASARATDTLGTPLNLRVGSEYCFSAAQNRVPGAPWCGRLAATWLPVDVSDPYWAGHVPETDVTTEHDSFFQVLGQFPGAVNSAIQQYVPDIAHISGANADSIVSAVNSLRGYYGVSSNDVFVSGLDSTITAFLARAAAASGPTLVTAFGLLAVALAATAFAALQFLDGHAAQLALWRARGWSRLRVWWLSCIEFATLAVVAIPPAILAAAAINSAAAGSADARPGIRWQRLADAAGPSVIASGAFLVILAGVAATRSGPELTQRRSDRSATQRRSWRRRAVDAGLVAAGIGALVLARAGGDTPTSAPGNGGLFLALPVLGAGMLAVASLRLVGVAARALPFSRGVGARLARWQLERDPAQVARLCLLVTLAVTVGVFASTYTASDRANAIDRADYLVGADMRATFSSAASPPQLARLSAALPAGVQAAQVFRGVGRPGRTGTDAALLGIQGPDFWNVAYARDDFAAQPLRTLTSTMASSDPDGSAVPGTPRALTVTVYSSGFDGRVDLEITDATGRDTVLPMGSLGVAGWADLSAPLATRGAPIAFPVKVRSLRILPTGSSAVGDVAVENLRTDSGSVIESFAKAHGWWTEAFAPDTAEAAATPGMTRSRHGEPSVDIPIDLQAVLLLPPPSSRPLPVLLAAPTMAALGVSIGQAFPVHIDTVDVQLAPVGSFDEFPTHYPAREDLIVAPRASLLARLGNQGSTSPWPNELWLKIPDGTAAAVNATVSADSTLLSSSLRSDAERFALSDPLRVGLNEELGLGFVVALAVVVVGFGLHFLAVARNRATQFAIMRANGVPQSTLRRSLLAEQVVVLVSGLLAGTAIGLLASWAVIPIFHLGALPEDLTPPSTLHVDPLTLVGVLLGTGAAALLMGRAVAGAGSHVDVMATVRTLA